MKGGELGSAQDHLWKPYNSQPARGIHRTISSHPRLVKLVQCKSIYVTTGAAHYTCNPASLLHHAMLEIEFSRRNYRGEMQREKFQTRYPDTWTPREQQGHVYTLGAEYKKNKTWKLLNFSRKKGDTWTPREQEYACKLKARVQENGTSNLRSLVGNTR